MKPAICLNLFYLVFIAILSASSVAQVHDPRALQADPKTAKKPIAPILDGLGTREFKVTTNNPKSQLFFNQGVRLNAAFNHSEALRSFKEAVRLDPENAMAYWGWALVLGPNLNLPMQDEVVGQAYQAVQSALALKDKVSERERDYIEALAVRYRAEAVSDRSALDQAYVDKMRDLVAKYPDDLDAKVYYAAAIMNTNPWDYWYQDGSPKPHTEIVMQTLAEVIQQDPQHPAAHHYLIHTVEAFRPELGVNSADALRNLMPGAGHLVHMPSHIYMRVGRYADSYKANQAAIKVDKKYITQCQVQGMYPLTYYPHNWHFLTWSAMFLGRYEDAMHAARQVVEQIPAGEMGNTWALNESFRSQPMFVLARFGRWDDILNEQAPAENEIFMTGVWHYIRGLAFANLNDIDKAQAEQQKLQTLQQKIVADTEYYIGFGAAGGLLEIANETLQGEILVAKKNYAEGIGHLQRAVRLQDGLAYNEPPDWYFPVRHYLADALLVSGAPAEAEVIYWQDLQMNPNNGYALYGLLNSLNAQGKKDTAAVIEKRFKKAWQDADMQLTSSKF
ncbi:hypothetical protein [Thalassotalea mangrovi]|uniref:Uncharacterized protein n=1 Tax=Thalassotalea mangrovi TaxID=2572245 RepID=A0A4U1BAX8_9GAMM|nr:hypothetical protein [Thalassotalea mangrovi]TKB47870.1 hypothetical protein E8M12_00230 [Thalassotalea mangrovi]